MRIGGVKISHVVEAAGRHAIPFRTTIRAIRRRSRPYEDDPQNSGWCVYQGLEQIAAVLASGTRIQGATVLEFGSGWLPLIPTLYHLAGAAHLIMTDIDRLMDAQTTMRARRIVGARLPEVAEFLGETVETLEARLATPMVTDYLVPWNAENQAANSIDIVFSRATLEHVPPQLLTHFFSHFHRMIRPGGATVHSVDNSDHWQHRDRTLSRVNFLRFDDRDLFWRFGQFNPQGYQNRFRHSDYIDMLERAGFRVDVAWGNPDPQCIRDLQDIPLNKRFQNKTKEDLATLTSLFIARKPGDGKPAAC